MFSISAIRRSTATKMRKKSHSRVRKMGEGGRTPGSRWQRVSSYRSYFCCLMSIDEGRDFPKRFAKGRYAVQLLHSPSGSTTHEATARRVAEKLGCSSGKSLGCIGKQNLRALGELQSFCSERC